MNSSPTDHELLRLFATKADGTITPEDHEKLCSLLTESPQARREWFAFQDAEDALQSWAQRATLIQSSAPAQTPTITSAKARPKRGVAWRITAAVAAGIVIGAVTWAVWPQPVAPAISPSGSNVVIQDEATTSAVAVLTRGVDLVWEGTGATPSLHEPLSPGELKLRSGVAEIEF
ncbi:MAG TPA: hypothetical protein VLE43_03805, partial [Candidatus Saccharimonadia bacterium]|nr:hypothetical protein [Candidatus Saccharimonadia bacterium]